MYMYIFRLQPIKPCYSIFFVASRWKLSPRGRLSSQSLLEFLLLFSLFLEYLHPRESRIISALPRRVSLQCSPCIHDNSGY